MTRTWTWWFIRNTTASMSSRSSSLWWKTFLLQLRRHTSEPPAAADVISRRRAEVSMFGHGYSTSRGLQILADGGKWRSVQPLAMAAAGFGPSGTPPPPPRFNLFPGWAKWLMGSVITLLLPPFWKAKWLRWKQIEGEAETVMESVEHVAEVVETVAEKAERITAEVAEKLPDDSKLKEAVLMAERFSKATAHEARVAVDIIHKVEELKQDTGDLETLVEPIVEKIVGKGEESKEAGK